MPKDRFEKPKPKMSGVGRVAAGVVKDVAPSKAMQRVIDEFAGHAGEDKRTGLERKYDIYEGAAHVNPSQLHELMDTATWTRVTGKGLENIIIEDTGLFSNLPLSAVITIKNEQETPVEWAGLPTITTTDIKNKGVAMAMAHVECDKATGAQSALISTKGTKNKEGRVLGLLTVTSNPSKDAELPALEGTSVRNLHKKVKIPFAPKGVIEGATHRTADNEILGTSVKAEAKNTLSDKDTLVSFIANHQNAQGVLVTHYNHKVGVLYHPDHAPKYAPREVFETSCARMGEIGSLRSRFIDATAIKIMDKAGNFDDKQVIAVLDFRVP